MVDRTRALERLCAALGVSQPYGWQIAAYERLVDGQLPGQVKVPTAAGKTMLLAVFVAALAEQARRGAVTLPRRLVHVVNRRVLVDEATRLAERIQKALDEVPDLAELREALASLSATGRSLVVSALRGGVEDNGQWSLDPAAPAIVLATPDMLGSRLLFRGYGLGRSRAATHAGLLGCDTLVVHDEAHLAPAFTALLRQIEAQADAGAKRLGRPPLRVIEMTATLGASQGRMPLVCDVSQDPALMERMGASKRLTLIDAQLLPAKAAKPQARVRDLLLEQALAYQGASKAVALFVSSPVMAEELAGRLAKAGVAADRILTLTGTMRGHERAQLSSTEAFRRFDPGTGRDETSGTAYFIATSAGEIGLDIDADVGLFDLTTLDRFIQRCGRVNRRGLTVGTIVLVHDSGEEVPERVRERALKALEILRGLDTVEGTADASPLALSRLCDRDDYLAATEPVPPIKTLEGPVLQMLSMTSLRLDELRCPAPDVYIHGAVEEEPEVLLAWRQLPAPHASLVDWLDAWPLGPAETARLPLEAARKFLGELLLSEPAQALSGTLAVLLDPQGLPVTDHAALRAGEQVNRWARGLRGGGVVLLSSAVGGVSQTGLPSLTAHPWASDVSVGLVDAEGIQRFALVSEAVSCSVSDEGVTWNWKEQEFGSLDDLLAALAGGLEVMFDDAPRSISPSGWQGKLSVWLSQPGATRTADAGDHASMIGRDRLLVEHLTLAGLAARRLSQRLALPDWLASAQIRGAHAHDKGKDWQRWQLAVGNADLERPLGKSASPRFNFKINDGYRHELGSVVDLGASLSPLERHVVATHHGWGRPSYSESARAKAGCEAAGGEVALGFAALGRSLGPWGLAYAEALLKAADILAEVQSEELAGGVLELPESIQEPALIPAPAMGRTLLLRLEPENFGEYLAGLGLFAFLDWRGHDLAAYWQERSLVLRGVDEVEALRELAHLVQAQVLSDERATGAATEDAAYPPLRLVLRDGAVLPMNHWLDERLSGSSRWKLGAGQTSALKTLQSVLRSCAACLELEDFSLPALTSFGGKRVNADTSKFRFDAATNWKARDAGFSLNENDALKSTRPWVELLSALGLQFFFPPPADQDARYFLWQTPLPLPLALAAARGLLPQSGSGFEPVFEPNGKMKDVFTSKPLTERSMPCQTFIRVI